MRVLETPILQCNKGDGFYSKNHAVFALIAGL